MEVLERAIKEAGGLTTFALRIGVKPQVVVNWRARGIPAVRVLDIERATEGKVTRHELRPDLYPSEEKPAAQSAQTN